VELTQVHPLFQQLYFSPEKKNKQKNSWNYTRTEMNPEIHVFSIPNFCVENKNVGEQKKH
jgi:hypothetical protein